MKKNYIMGVFLREKLLIKCLLIFLLTFGVSSFTHAQEASTSKVTVAQLFKQIESSSTYKFFYSNDDINTRQRVFGKGENESVKNVMDRIAAKLGIKYEIKDKQTILVFNKTVPNYKPVKITGTITDEKGDTLPGATVLVKGTTTGTTTDLDGKFAMEAPAGAPLVFSYIGYLSKTIPASSKMLVKLEPDTKTLDEVVVVGYGTQVKRDVTGAVSGIKGDELEGMQFTGADQALQGRISGVQVQQNSGSPGGGISLRIRGVTSLGSNEPLYVVDGVQLTGDSNNGSEGFAGFAGGNAGQTTRSALSGINAADIESIEVLKDASAQAIYGARASNGVVIITTKRGKKGESTISYETNYGFQYIPKKIELLNLPEFVSFVNETNELDNKDPILRPDLIPYLGEGTDWQDEIFRVAPTQEHILSIASGKGNTKFYTSVGYKNQEGIVINSGFDRLSFKLNIDHKVNNWVDIGTSINVARTDELITFNNSATGVVSSAVRQSPMVPVRFNDGSFGGNNDRDSGSTAGGNPVAWSEIRSNTLQRTKVFGNFFVNMKLLEGLTFKNSVSVDLNLNDNQLFNPTYEIGENKNKIATSIKSYAFNQYRGFNNLLNYRREFGKHTASILLGHELQGGRYENIRGIRRDFLTNKITNLSSGSTENAEVYNNRGAWAMQSVFSRINYSYNSKYLLTASFRADGSSNFHPDRRWGYFPAISGGWVISNENFMSSLVNYLNYAKVRLGYGAVGNANTGGSLPWLAVLQSQPSAFGTGVTQNSTPNEFITWESQVSVNLGIELGFLNDRIRIDADFYQKESRDFLSEEVRPDYLGAYSLSRWNGLRAPKVNDGVMENKGVDIKLETVNIDKTDFSWLSTVIISAYRNELKSRKNPKDLIIKGNSIIGKPFSRTEVGKPIGLFYGARVIGIFQSEEEIAASPTQSEAKPGDL